MNDTTTSAEARPVQLDPDRLAAIRTLTGQLTGRPDPDQAPRLLADARTALLDLLADRDDLVRANAAAGEELARWKGEL